MKTIETKSGEETKSLARRVAKCVRPGDIIGLIGELGAGKTTFIQGLARGLGVSKKTYVSSPTYTILKIYPGKFDIYHFDFYRLEDAYEFEELGFEDYLKGGCVAVVEWADKFIDLLPKKTKKIYFEVTGENRRKIKLELPL